jgi:hypothetical protein
MDLIDAAIAGSSSRFKIFVPLLTASVDAQARRCSRASPPRRSRISTAIG